MLNRPLTYFGSFMLLGTLIAFFGFHSLTGERGLLMRDNLDREIAAAQEHLQLLKKENTQLESRISLMRSDIVDKDILEEMARSELGLFADNDILILPNID
ncbi:MAG: septum formation initiator [SAR116 cluster bacterium]|nr:septum formation initiator [SAR116 cluster bacterium]RCL79545.1 MAG: septum formation initiator family protein [SAR116 cluster bacterium]